MDELTDAQREVLKTLPVPYLVKLRAAVGRKRELEEQWRAEEERVAKLREVVQDWKLRHEKAYEDAISAIQVRLNSSAEGVTQSQAHVDKTKQIQLASLDEQLARRRTEMKTVEAQVAERQSQIDMAKASILELHMVMARKKELVSAFSSGSPLTPRSTFRPVTRRPTMTMRRGESGIASPAYVSRVESSGAPSTPRSARDTPLMVEPDALEPLNTPETADHIAKIDIEAVPARVILEALQELVLEPSHFLVQCMNSHVRPNEQDKLGRAWVDIFLANGEFMNLLKATVSREVDITTEIGTLFRSNSMASRMMSSYSRAIGMSYIQSLLKPKIDAIIASKENLEIDSMKIAGDQVEAQREQVVVSPQMIDSNVTKLTEHAIDFIQTIMAGKAKAPLEYYQICHMLKDLVAAKFPSQWKIAIGGYLFLRLMCPCIFLPPDDFGYNFEAVSPESKRTLVLVSKILQNLANLQPKFVEEIMTPFSSFVTFNLRSVENYFEFMTHIPPNLPATPVQEGPIRQRLREVLAIAASNHAKLSTQLSSSTNPLASQEFIQLWSFSKAPKLLSLYNKLTIMGTTTGISEDSPDVGAFINTIVPLQPTISPITRSASSRDSLISSLPLSHLTNPPEPPHVLLAILETSTRLDFSSVENAELAASLYPIWEYRSRTGELIQQALEQFLNSPTKSNRPVLDSVPAKVLTIWSQRLLGPLIKHSLAPSVLVLTGKPEVTSNRDVLLEITGNFLDSILNAFNELPEPVYQLCHRISTSPRLGIPAVVEFVICLIWVKALEDPEAFGVPTGGGDRLIRKALLMIADLLTLVAISSRDRQNAAIDSFLTSSTAKTHAAADKWLKSVASPKITPARIPWSDVTAAIDNLRIFIGKNMSSISAILDNTTTQNRYIKFTISEVVANMVKHTAAKATKD